MKNILEVVKNSIQSEKDFIDLLSIQIKALELVLQKTNPQLWDNYQQELYILLKQRNFQIPNLPIPDDL